MVKICYLLLCHKDPESVIEQITYLRQAKGYVVVHIDKSAPRAFHNALHTTFKDTPDVIFARSVKAGWGDWSLVKATLGMVTDALDAFPDATHFYYLSGDCMPICSSGDLIHALSADQMNFIETADFFTSNWIKTGPHLERIEFYHFLNERKYKKLFYLVYKLHRFFKIKRKIPVGINLSIGSQWWCLKRSTLELILIFLHQRPDVIRFFKWNWIPDEIFFQTLVATLVRPKHITNRPPTFLRFSDYGIPVVFYDDHYAFLKSQNGFFARKISPNSKQLKKRLIRDFLEPTVTTTPRYDGQETIGFTTYAGRLGYRFGPNIWEKNLRLEDSARIVVLLSKKWHVGHAMGDALDSAIKTPYYGYIFDEDSWRLRNMGGLEQDRAKRSLNPVAFLQIMLNACKKNEMVFSLDPFRIDILAQLVKSVSNLHVLEIENRFSSKYLDGHAERSGLVYAAGGSVQRGNLHHTILETFSRERSMLYQLNLKNFSKISGWQKPKMRAEILAKHFERDSSMFLELAQNVDIYAE